MELTEKQAAFAANIVSNGGNGSKAAIDAGYAEESARIEAWRLQRKPHVEAAIHTEQRRQLGSLANAAIGVLGDLLNDEKTPKGVLLDAAKCVLDRAGYNAKSQDEDRIDRKALDEMSIEELEEFIQAGRVALGLEDQDSTEITNSNQDASNAA